MAKLAVSYIHYPLSVGGFFKRALKRMGHEVIGIGPFYTEIPWQPQTDYSAFWDQPEIEVMPSPGAASVPLADVLPRLPNDLDAIIMFDAGFHLSGGYDQVPIALVATDPHCLAYGEQAKDVNAFFVMQHAYMDRYSALGGKTDSWPPPQWLPYAYDPTTHYWIPGQPEYDVVFVGVLYPNRQRLLRALRDAGLKVLAAQGVLFHEGTSMYAQGKIALNLSSRNDLPMRFWEGLAYRRAVLTNYAPDLDLLYSHRCYRGEQYITYNSRYDPDGSDIEVVPDEADVIDKARWLVAKDRWRQVSDAGYVWVQPHTYEERCRQILEGVGISP